MATPPPDDKADPVCPSCTPPVTLIYSALHLFYDRAGNPAKKITTWKCPRGHADVMVEESLTETADSPQGDRS